MLETDDTAVPAVAIFTDGRTFHATVAHNRLADDAAKRQILRDTGRIVLAVTAADVQQAEEGTVTPPPWFAETTVQQLISLPPFMATPAAYAGLRDGPDRLARRLDQRTLARERPDGRAGRPDVPAAGRRGGAPAR